MPDASSSGWWRTGVGWQGSCRPCPRSLAVVSLKNMVDGGGGGLVGPLVHVAGWAALGHLATSGRRTHLSIQPISLWVPLTGDREWQPGISLNCSHEAAIKENTP